MNTSPDPLVRLIDTVDCARGKMAPMPNQPKTPVRGFRSGVVWEQAQLIAAERDETMTSILNGFLEEYVKEHTASDRP